MSIVFIVLCTTLGVWWSQVQILPSRPTLLLLSGRLCGYRVIVFVLISVWMIGWYRTHSLLRDRRVSGSIDQRQKSNREGRLIGIDSDTNPRDVVPQSAR